MAFVVAAGTNSRMPDTALSQNPAHIRIQPVQRLHRYLRGDAEYAHADQSAGAGDKSHAEGVTEENAGEREKRVRLTYPRSKAALFKALKKIHHRVYAQLDPTK